MYKDFVFHKKQKQSAHDCIGLNHMYRLLQLYLIVLIWIIKWWPTENNIHCTSKCSEQWIITASNYYSLITCYTIWYSTQLMQGTLSLLPFKAVLRSITCTIIIHLLIFKHTWITPLPHTHYTTYTHTSLTLVLLHRPLWSGNSMHLQHISIHSDHCVCFSRIALRGDQLNLQWEKLFIYCHCP